MSTLLDVESVVLRDLDFTPSCDCSTPQGPCSNEATHRLVCTACGRDACLTCMEHAIYARRQSRVVTHMRCGASAPMRVLVEAVWL